MGASTSPHPTDQTLHDYGLGKLDDASADSIDAHLKGCPECRRRTAEMAPDSFLGRLRHGRSTDGLRSTPAPAGSAVSSPVGTLPPELADHKDYELVRELGRGGMGVVYLVRNRLMGRHEVLKVMAGHLVERPEVRERFLREIRSVASLRHPNIVAAHHAFHVGETIAFTMEHVEGYDLSGMVKARGPLPVAHACLFAHQAAQGLQHAHEEGMVHRDIKPGNLMVARRGDKAVVKVLDFGLAKAVREGQLDGALTHAGQMLGTPDFIAPEQISDAQSADIRADIYSLGCTLYYLLSGGPPFQASSLYDLLQAHHSMDARLLNFVRPEVPSELAALVAKMMAKEPERRFPTPAAVSEALAPFYKAGNAAHRPAAPEVSRAASSEADRPSPVPRPTSPVAESPKQAAAPRPEEMWATLIGTREKKPEAEPTPPESAASDSMQKPPRKSRLAIGAASLSGAVALGIIIVIIIRNGKDDSKIVVKKEGSGVTVDVPKGSDIGPDERTDEPPTPRIAAPSGGPPPVATDFTPLFNGKDTTGWKTHSSQRGHWQVQDGILVGSGPAISHLYTDRGDYKDFHLRAVARYNGAGPSGVFVRASDGPGPTKDEPDGYKVSINSADGARGNTGSLRSFLDTKECFEERTPVPPRQWFTMDILASDETLAVFIDGRLASIWMEKSRKYSDGRVALRQTPNTSIEFRSVAIREIDRKARPDSREVVLLKGHTDRVTAVAFSPDSKRVLSGDVNMITWHPGNTHWGAHTTRLWDATDGRALQKMKGPEPATRSVAFCPDGNYSVACGGWGRPENQRVLVSELATGREAHLFTPPKAPGRMTVHSAVFSADGSRVLSAFEDGTIRAWELKTGKELPPMRPKVGTASRDEFPAMLLTSDGRRLITGSRNGPVELWNLGNGERLRLFAGHVGPIRQVACSGDGRLILSGGVDGTARLWDSATGEQLQVLPCGEDGLWSVAISPDGRLALTGDSFGTIGVWDLKTGRETCRLRGHTLKVNALAISSDGRRAVSGSDDKTVRIWRLEDAGGLPKDAPGPRPAPASGPPASPTAPIAIGPEASETAADGTGGPAAGEGERTDAPVGKPPAPPAAKGAKATSPLAAPALPVGAGFIPLLKKGDLSGWTFSEESSGQFNVDGVLAFVTRNKGGVMATRRSDFRDFHFVAELRTDDSKNSGLLFRSTFGRSHDNYYGFSLGGSGAQRAVEPLGRYGVRLQGKVFASDQIPSDLKALVVPSRVPLSRLAWHRVEIIARGNVFRMLVDGEEVSAFEDPQSRFAEGKIALWRAGHSRVEFRGVWIKVLNDPKRAGEPSVPPAAPTTAGAEAGKSVPKPSSPAVKKPDDAEGSLDAFQPGTVWRGGHHWTSGGVGDDFAVVLHVLERRDTTFLALVESKPWKRKVAGRIVRNTISWKTTAILTPGAKDPGPDYSGTIRGGKVTVGYANHRQPTGKVISGTIVLNKE